MKNVLVFFGGKSCEHDVSVLTGVMTANCLDGEGYNSVPVYVGKNGKWYGGEELKNLGVYDGKRTFREVTLLPSDNFLYEIKKGKLKKREKIDCAINCMHGLNGEDGSLAGALKLASVPLASPDIFSSAVSMDKYFTKIALAGIRAPYVPYVKLNRENYYKNKAFAKKLVARLGSPIIIKPANLGSSIGITVVKTDDKFEEAVELAFRYDDKVVAEKALTDFREINCACYKLGNRYIVSPCEEPVTKHDVLTFDEKYVTPAEKKFPAEIDKKLSDKIRDLTAYVYRKLEFSGIIRIDFLLDGNDVYVNEINSVPGSLAYYLFVENTDEFGKILHDLVENAIKKHEYYENNVFTYDGGTLSFDNLKK